MTPAPQLSVVIATWNRQAALRRLLSQLAVQQGAPPFEVVVVDDGSKEPVQPFEAGPMPVALARQDNAGAAAARHRGIGIARGEIIVITDDDMQVGPGFLAAHFRRHAQARVAVLGEIRPAPEIAQMPLFERYHADSLLRQAAARDAGSAELHGNHLCTGNVSLRRADYFAVGGFDLSLERSEDADLGIRLELAGVPLVYDRDAWTMHSSDHTDLPIWLARAFRYGEHDQRIASKYPQVRFANPWRYLFGPRFPLLAGALAAPALAARMALFAFKAGEVAASAGLEKVALKSAGLAWVVQYYAGLRHEAGSLRESLRRAASYLRTPRP